MSNRGLVIPFIELGTMGVEERIKTRCPCGPCNVRYLFVIQVGILNSRMEICCSGERPGMGMPLWEPPLYWWDLANHPRNDWLEERSEDHQGLGPGVGISSCPHSMSLPRAGTGVLMWQ